MSLDAQVLMISRQVFSVLRISPEGDQHLLTLTNVTNRTCPIEIPLSDLKVNEHSWYDLLNEKVWKAENGKLSIPLKPYDVIWLKPGNELKRDTSQ